MTKVMSAQDAAARIEDGAVVSVSSSSTLGCPDAVLKAIGARFEDEGYPRNITSLHPIAAGDVYGVKGMDYLPQDGLLGRVLAGSYPSGPSSVEMPAIWKMIVENRVAAYNVPSGIMFDMHREAAAKRPGVRVPGHLVDCIVIDADQKQNTETPYDPAISGEVMRPWSSFSLAQHGVEKVIARRAALELKRGMTANLGFGISAMVPRILLEEGHTDAVTWAIEQGALGGDPLTGFAFGCASNADAFVPSLQQFIYFQGAGFDMSFLSFLEVDTEGDVNVSKLGKKPYLTAACGGFVDITAHARNIVFSGWFEAGAKIDLTDDGIRIVEPGRFTKMVDEVEHVTFSGRRAREQGQNVLYVTERCVIRLTGNGLVATEIMPGVTPERDIVAASGGRVQVAENATVMPRALLADAPMGLAL